MINLGEEGEIGKGVGEREGVGEGWRRRRGEGDREGGKIRGIGLKGGEGWRERERWKMLFYLTFTTYIKTIIE